MYLSTSAINQQYLTIDLHKDAHGKPQFIVSDRWGIKASFSEFRIADPEYHDTLAKIDSDADKQAFTLNYLQTQLSHPNRFAVENVDGREELIFAPQ